MTAQSEKSIICKKPRLTALHAGIVLTPPLGEYDVCDVTLSVYPHRASLKNMPGRCVYI
jgi:hypothetical protein